MFSTKLTRIFRLSKVRQLHSTFVKNESKPVSETSNTTAKSNLSKEQLEHIVLGSPTHRVSKIDKLILVWVKRFPSLDKVPTEVTIECIQKAHTKVRIRICFMMMIFAMVGFYMSSRSGKRDVASGQNILTERMKWYNAVKEQGEREAEAAKKG